MSNINNTTKVHFAPDQDYIWNIKGLEQWDKFQKLEISGLDISNEIVEVHFSLDQFQGTAERMYGTVKDGVIHANIPVFILEGPEYLYSNAEVYNAYAWVYVSDEESAETIRKMEFEIKARPKPNGYASPDKQDPFLQEIRQVMNETKDIAQSVRDDADAGKFNGGGSIDQEALLQLAIKTTTSPSPFHHITDSANMKVVDFGMEGKTEQKTTEGRNWISEKFSDYESGLYSATDGTKTDNVNAVRLKELIPVSNSVIYNYVESPVEGVAFLVRGYGENKEFLYNLGKLASGSTKFIQNDTKYLSISLINDDITMTLSDWKETFENGLKLYICSNTDNSTYEPYTNGPSPNPDFQQDIELAGVYNEATGRYEIGCSVVNANLLDYMEVVNNFRNKNYEQLASGYIVTSLQFKPNTEYYMKVNGIRCTWATFLISTQQNVNGSVGKAVGISNTWDSEKCVTTDETGLIYFGIAHPVDNQLDRIEQTLKEALVQIEIGSSATPYKPHDSQPLTLTSPVPLTKWDYLTKRDGVWGWSVNSEKNVLTTSKNYTISYKDDTSCVIGHQVPNALHLGQIISNRVVRGGITGGYCNTTRIYNGVLQVRLAYPEGITRDTANAEIIDAFKLLFTEKEFVFYYPTVEEQAFHPLPDEEQTLLNNLETYYGVTNVYNEQGCPMWLTYVADTKLYTDKKIAEQIAQTQALILEN